MIPPVSPSLTSSTSPTPPSPQAAGLSFAPGAAGGQADSGQASGQTAASPPVLQSSVVPAHNVAGFVFKIADTETGQVVVELPFLADPNAAGADGTAKVDVRV
jgi:hypothetical protein